MQEVIDLSEKDQREALGGGQAHLQGCEKQL